MILKNILVVKETKATEKRVALIPEHVPFLKKENLNVFVESGAGIFAGYTDADYVKSGAQIRIFNESYSDLFEGIDLIIRAKRASSEREVEELSHIRKGTLMIGALDPFEHDGAHLQNFKKYGIKAYSLDQAQLSSDDPMNILTSMSQIAGKVSFSEALKLTKKERIAQCSIIGAGVAGLSALHEASHYAKKVFLFARKKPAETLEKNIEVCLLEAELSLKEQQEFILKSLVNSQIIITCARASRQTAPLFIPESSLLALHAGTVVVDLALSEGGNVFGSRHDATFTTPNGVIITNESGYPKRYPGAASILWSQASLAFVQNYLKNKNDERLLSCKF